MPRIPYQLVACFALFLLAVAAPDAGATTLSPTSLNGSISPVPSAPTTGAVNPHKAYISRATLTSAEQAATIDFEVVLKMRNFPDLQARVAHGERISVPEMAAKYQPSAADYKTVVDWLVAQGFKITRRDRNHLAVFARGTVAQLGKALDMSFARVKLEGTEYTSAISAPNVPANIAPLIVGVNGLQPQIRPHKHLVPRANSVGSTNPPYLPSQIAQAYHATGLYQDDMTGSGQTIAIVIDTFPATSDLVSYWKTYQVNQSLNNIQFIQVVPGALSAPSGEETLDVEWSSSIAPGAKVRVYATLALETNYLDEAYQRIYDDVTGNSDLHIHQMSMSYGIGETYIPQCQVTTDDQYFAELASAGVTIFASSGDGGSTPGTASAGDETGPLQAESPASDPNITAVGGTSLVLDSSGAESSEKVWNNSYGASGGGTSEYFSRPSWQTGTGVPSGAMRLVPDLACSADPNYGAAVIINGVQAQYGGTSWASPTVAGFCALLNEARVNAGLATLGLLGPDIYPLIGSPNFRDITTVGNATSNSNGLYAATTGYDEATGIGVPLVQPLAQNLIGSSPLLGVQVQPLIQTVGPGQTATFTASAGGTPASYQWQVMPVGSTTWSSLSNGGSYGGVTTPTLTITSPTTALSGDSYQCLVTYSGSNTLTTTSSVLIVDTPLLINTFAGAAGTSGNVDGTGTAAEFAYPSGIALDTSGNLYIADYNNSEIREITPAGVVTTPYGSPLNTPNGVAADRSNNLYVADTGNNLIRKISDGVITTLGDSTTFNTPNGIAVDASGTVYVADTGNDVIREISPAGTVTTLAGQVGVAGYLDGTGTAAEFNSPTGVAVDASGNVYVADFGNIVVRKITSAGVVTTLAGQAGVAGVMDGVGTSALFNAPNGVAVDTFNNIYVTDALIPPIGSTEAGNNLLRKITSAGVVSTLAGQAGVAGAANGPGAAAQFYSLQAAAIASGGEVYLADTYNQTIRTGGVAPSIFREPVGEVITAGQPASFAVTVSGTGPFSYQWEKDGNAIDGATGSTYTIASTSGTDTGAYSVVVSNAFGSVTSNSASLVVVVSQPVAQTASPGGSVTFSIVVSSTGGPYSYQYLFNGASISGASGPSYTISNVSSANAGSYSVVVSDAYGIVTTDPVTLTVNTQVATDSPTLPEWGLILLAALLFLVGSPRRCQNQRT